MKNPTGSRKGSIPGAPVRASIQHASASSAPSASSEPGKPRKSKASARNGRLDTFTVHMSAGQARIIRRYAFALRATPADLIASLALSEIGGSDGSDPGPVELDSYNSALTEFVVQRRLPPDGSKRLVGITHLPFQTKKGGAA